MVRSVRSIEQGTIAVVTMFGKYRRLLYPGLNFVVPFVERVNMTVSVQNRSMELAF